MEDRVVEKRTVVEHEKKSGGQTTNVNIRPDGGADVQVNEDPTPAGGTEVIRETTTTTTERRP